MKINEILNEDLVEPELRQLPQSVPFNLRKMGQKAKSTDFAPNTGAYAVGVPDPKDPFMYRKKLKQPSKLDKDAYYQYIKFVQPYTDSNPFFPKVYKIDIKTDPRGLQKPAYTMEKLVSLAEADRMTDGKLENILLDKYLHNSNIGIDLVNYIYYLFHRPHYLDNVKDKNLKEAVSLIKTFIDNHPEFLLDVHAGNLMIRFTSTGPQLVFTDPVQDRGESIVGYNVFSGDWTKETEPKQVNEKFASQQQAKLMYAAAGNKDVSKKTGVSQKVAKEFIKKSHGQKVSNLPKKVKKD